MSLIFESLLTEGIAQLSYLIGDDKSGTAAVIDPRTDVDEYVTMARKRKVTITHIFETHIHADFVSGARELADRVQTADIYASHEGGADYGFESTVHQAGFDLYETRTDKDWSLTDCVSFTVMKQRGLSEALTADHHFEQAGFRAVFK